MTIRCPICAADARLAFQALLLRRHEVQFQQCPACGYLYSDRPHWLDEAYASALARADTGIVFRNLDIARKLTCLLFEMFGSRGRFLDAAGGSGLLTRLMRDTGFNFSWEDRYCQNLLAPGFEAAANETGFDAVTAIEVFEHLHAPLPFVERQLARSPSRTLIFTTELYEGEPPARDWWYYAFEMGQHIGFFQRRTLETIARRYRLKFHSAHGIHLFTDLDLSPERLRAWLRPGWWLRRRARRGLQPLIQADFARMIRDAGTG